MGGLIVHAFLRNLARLIHYCGAANSEQHMQRRGALERTSLEICHCSTQDGANRLTSLIVVIALSLVACQPWFGSKVLPVPAAYGTPWSKPFGDSASLGAALEDQFGYMLAGCGIRAIDDHARSAVPLILQQSMRSELSGSVVSYPGQSSWNMFRFVTETGNLDGFPSLSLQDYLDASLIGPIALPVPAPGSRAIVHFQSCSSIVNAALKAGLTVPIATLNLALSSDYEDNTSVALVDGSFFSPVATVLNASASAAQQHRAMFAAWQYLTALGDVYGPKKTYSFLGGFRGVVVFTIRNAARKTDASFQGSAAVTVPVGGINALLKVSTSGNDSTDVRDYSTIIFTGQDKRTGKGGVPQVQMVALPSPAAINNSLWQVKVSVLDSAAVVSPTTTDLKRKFTTYELPARTCDDDKWYANAESRFPGDSLLDPGVEMSFKDSTCSITLSVQLPGHFADSLKKFGHYSNSFILWYRDQLIAPLPTDTTKRNTFAIGFYLPVKFVYADSVSKTGLAAGQPSATSPGSTTAAQPSTAASSAAANKSGGTAPKRPSGGKPPPRDTIPVRPAGDSVVKKPPN